MAHEAARNPRPSNASSDDAVSYGVAHSATRNDYFADRTDLGFVTSATVSGSTVGYTGETGEMMQSGAVHSAWWSWTAPSTGILTVDTKGSDFDTYLTLASGTAVDALAVIEQDDDGGNGLQSLVKRVVTSGTEYYFAVDGFGSSVGQITLNVTFTPILADGPKVFHLLALIYPQVQIPQRGSAPAASAVMDQATLDAVVQGVHVELPVVISQLAGDQIQARVHVEVVDRPLDQLYWDGNNYQWASESMVAPELDAFTRSGWYDHVFVFHGLANEIGPTAWWGGGGLARYGMSMASHNFSRSSGLLGDHDVPGMIHEWIHGLEVQYFGEWGVYQGNDPDGQPLDLHDAVAFGYTDSTESRPGWSVWYRDFLTDHIRNLPTDSGETGLGLGPDAWALGVPRSHYEYTSGSPLERPDVTSDGPAYLSDIYWASAQTEWGAVRRDATVDGNPIGINGVGYDKGVGIHSNGTILVNLRGRAERFQADVGLDDDMAGPNGSIVFRVYGDGELLFESPVMTFMDDAAMVDVDVTGVQQLRLVVEDAGDGGHSDHGVWANALFLPFRGEFISELRWDLSSSEWGTIHLDRTLERHDIHIDGVRYGKGVGIHANGRIVVPLDGHYTTFHSHIGINQDVHVGGSVVFEVYVDGDLAYQSPTMRSSNSALPVIVDVTGAQELQLIVRDAGDGLFCDHGIWAGAYLIPHTTLAVLPAEAVRAEGDNGSTAFSFTVTRAGLTTGATTVAWAATGSGTNPADAMDFTGGSLPSGTLSFAAGETSKTITVNVAGDTVVELDEGFTITLSGPTGATISTAIATGTITKDDASPWQNPRDPFDVDDLDGITAIDVLIIINYINFHPADSSLPAPPAVLPAYYDVNGDGSCTPVDVLSVINQINVGSISKGAGEPHALAAASSSSAMPAAHCLDQAFADLDVRWLSLEPVYRKEPKWGL